jgi:hypothetical protein
MGSEQEKEMKETIMKSQATYDDIDIILRLYEMRREDKLRKARAWFSSNFKVRNLDDFNRICPMGSEENAYFRMVTSYWEMAASFITNGVLHEEIFFESGGEILFVWEKMRDIVPAYREARKNPIAFKNLETVANAYIDWMNRQAPGWYTVYRNMILGGSVDPTKR